MASPSRMLNCLLLDEIFSEFSNKFRRDLKISDTQDISRKDFPEDFKFGCSTSALQTEGSGTEGGRGPSTWDDFIGHGEKAVDSYNRYKEDVQLLDDMKADFYRFSISWSRLLPDGTISGGINQEGIDFYNNLINELKRKNITPFVTLFHFDLPTALQNKYKGFLNSQIVMLEPLVFGHYPFSMKALVRDNLPKFTDDQKTLIEGSYDFIGVNYYTSRYASAVPLTLDETYTSLDQYQHVNTSVSNKAGKPIGKEAPGEEGIYVYPPGLGKALVYISKFYNKPKIYVTENGYPEKRDDSIRRANAVHDNARIQHIKEHLQSVKGARKLGADVKGYCMWSLMDCLEMGSAYNVRYGLCYTDYSTLKRYPKDSSRWLKNFVTSK